MLQRVLAILLTLAAISGGEAFAAPSGSVALSSSKMFQIKHSSGTFLCGKIGSKYVPGSMVKGSSKLFWPYTAQEKSMKKQISAAKGSKKSALKKSLAKMQKKMKLGKPVCLAGPPSGGGGSGGSGGSGGGDSTSGFCFDGNGNATSAGKSAFQIPSGLQANITSGMSTYKSFCVGCHSEHPKNFPQLRTAIAQSPMLFTSTQISDATLANLTAYLKRYQLSCP